MTAFWLVLMGYLIGSIPIAYLAARLRGHDLLDEGAGGVSGSAAIEQLGPVPGAAAGFLDALKPVLVVAVAQRFETYEVSAAAGVAAVCGHIWPVTLRWRGGRGIGPAGALLAALGAWQMCLAFAGLVLGRALLRDSAPGALVGFFATAVLLSLTGQSLTIGVTAWVVVGVVVLGRLIGYRKVRTEEDVGLARLMVRRLILDRDER
ncbi:MAG: glycerol-3-phosphate acyltransferase [Chloroflexota bacterium]|nr:glycerol-3-phosphate acyltransferase [Chloroflexota bacterium]